MTGRFRHEDGPHGGGENGDDPSGIRDHGARSADEPTQASLALSQVLESVATRIHRAGYAEGLQPVHWLALRYFSRCNPSAASVMQFARHHGTTRGSASVTISLLVSQGLLDRQPDETDKRRHYLFLTERGLDLLKCDPLKPIALALEGLSPQQRVVLSQSLEVVLRALPSS